MNAMEIEKKYQEKKAEMMRKYNANIMSFSNHHGVDSSVAWDMLFFNAKMMAAGTKKEIIAGGGKINQAELLKDYAVLADLIRQQKGNY